MSEFRYKPVAEIVEDIFFEHTKTNVYDSLGNIDFDKITLIVNADTEEESLAIRKSVTDIRMWIADR